MEDASGRIGSVRQSQQLSDPVPKAPETKIPQLAHSESCETFGEDFGRRTGNACGVRATNSTEARPFDGMPLATPKPLRRATCCRPKRVYCSVLSERAYSQHFCSPAICNRRRNAPAAPMIRPSGTRSASVGRSSSLAASDGVETFDGDGRYRHIATLAAGMVDWCRR